MADMRQWVIPADEIRSDAVAYTAAAAASLTQVQNAYIALVGANVLKYRQDEILDTINWLKNTAMAAMDTARFPRPANGAGVGGTFLKAKLIATDFGQKNVATLVTSTNLGAHPLTDDDAVYWGYTAPTTADAVNTAVQLGSVAMDNAFEEFYQFYIQSAQASA